MSSLSLLLLLLGIAVCDPTLALLPLYSAQCPGSSSSRQRTKRMRQICAVFSVLQCYSVDDKLGLIVLSVPRFHSLDPRFFMFEVYPELHADYVAPMREFIYIYIVKGSPPGGA